MVMDPYCQKVFYALKQAFTFKPILAHFDSSLQFIVEIDASDYAVSTVHSQGQKNSHIHPCAFLSRKFSPAEMIYHIHDKQMLAIVLVFQE